MVAEPKIGISDYFRECAGIIQANLYELQSKTEQIGNIWESARTPTHGELINLCKELLILEGYDPLRIHLEYPIHILDKKYVADIVVLNEKNRVDIIVECGKLTDPMKIQVFNTMFNRFIWIPFTMMPNLELLRSFKQQARLIVSQYEKIGTMIDKMATVAEYERAIRHAGLASIQELVEEFAEFNDAQNIEPLQIVTSVEQS